MQKEQDDQELEQNSFVVLRMNHGHDDDESAIQFPSSYKEEFSVMPVWVAKVLEKWVPGVDGMDKLVVQFFGQPSADINGIWKGMLDNNARQWRAEVPRNSVMLTMLSLAKGKIPVRSRERLGKYYKGPYVKKHGGHAGTLVQSSDWGGWDAWDCEVKQVLEPNEN